MAVHAITIIAVQDTALVYNNPGNISRREGQTHILPLGSYFEQSEPPTTEWSVAESGTGDAFISDIGLSIAENGTFTTSLTLTDTQARALATNLWLQFTLADVSQDETIVLNITSTDVI